MCLSDSLILPNTISPPIDIEDDEGDSSHILPWNFIVPRLVSIRPDDFIVVGKFCLISLLEIFLPDLLLSLNGAVLVISPPIIVVVVVTTKHSLS